MRCIVPTRVVPVRHAEPQCLHHPTRPATEGLAYWCAKHKMIMVHVGIQCACVCENGTEDARAKSRTWSVTKQTMLSTILMR